MILNNLVKLRTNYNTTTIRNFTLYSFVHPVWIYMHFFFNAVMSYGFENIVKFFSIIDKYMDFEEYLADDKLKERRQAMYE